MFSGGIVSKISDHVSEEEEEEEEERARRVWLVGTRRATR